MHKHETRNVLDLLKKQLGKIESQFLGPHYPSGQLIWDPDVIPSAGNVQILDEETLTRILQQAITKICDAIDFRSLDTKDRFEIGEIEAFLLNKNIDVDQFKLIEQSKLSEIFHKFLVPIQYRDYKLMSLTSAIIIQIVTDKKILTDEEISKFIFDMVRWQFEDYDDNDHIERFMDLIRKTLNTNIADSCLDLFRGNHASNLNPYTLQREMMTREEEMEDHMRYIFHSFDLV
jgi:hypothetical protein